VLNSKKAQQNLLLGLSFLLIICTSLDTVQHSISGIGEFSL